MTKAQLAFLGHLEFEIDHQFLKRSEAPIILAIEIDNALCDGDRDGQPVMVIEVPRPILIRRESDVFSRD